MPLDAVSTIGIPIHVVWEGKLLVPVITWKKNLFKHSPVKIFSYVKDMGIKIFSAALFA